jgi:hypothetical protein
MGLGKTFEASSSSENSADSGVGLVPSFIVPEYIESVETLEYIGWGKEKATDIWAGHDGRWSSSPKVMRLLIVFSNNERLKFCNVTVDSCLEVTI